MLKLRRFWRLTGMLAVAFHLAAQEDPGQAKPASLVIQYQCLPNHRSQLRTAGIDSLSRYEALRTNGILTGYHVLFSRYVNTDNWDMLTVLNFRTLTDLAKWKGVELRDPAGLSGSGLEAASAIFTYPADDVRGNASDSPSAHPVYVVIPYTLSVSPPAYLQYVDNYVRLEFEGWMHEGVLTSYEVFLQRYASSRPWDSLILLQYKDDDSLGLREIVAAKVRTQLAGNPAWRALGDKEHTLRAEKELVIADELVAGR